MLFFFALQSKQFCPVSSGNSCQQLFTHRSQTISETTNTLPSFHGEHPRQCQVLCFARCGSEDVTPELLCSASLPRLPHPSNTPATAAHLQITSKDSSRAQFILECCKHSLGADQGQRGWLRPCHPREIRQ